MINLYTRRSYARKMEVVLDVGGIGVVTEWGVTYARKMMLC